MATCEICGKEAGEQPEVVRLYAAHLAGREVHAEGIEAYTAPQIATSYKSKPKVVNVTTCGRHRLDLLKQRVLTGFFVLVLLYLPVLFVVGKITDLFHMAIQAQVITAVVVSLAAVVALMIWLVRYDSLVAVRMTTKSKMEKSDVEYMTERKYRKVMSKTRRAAAK
jgi:hypothetical protein